MMKKEMMKKVILSLVVLFVFTNVFSQGIEFERGTFAEVMAKAKEENKVVFIDCYTQWCGPCKILEKKVFTQKEVGDFFNKNFVNVKMDMESEEGKPLMKKYEVFSFPTLLWLDANGNIAKKHVGSCDANLLIDMATLALNPENSLNSLKKRFKKGERGLDFLQKYIWGLGTTGGDIQEVADLYLSRKKPVDMFNETDILIIMNVVKTSSNPIFRFVIKNKAKFYAIAPKNEFIDDYIGRIMADEMRQLAEKGDMDALNLKKKEFITLDKELGTKAFEAVEKYMSK